MPLCAPCRNFIDKHLHWEVVPSSSYGYSHSQAKAIEERSPETFLCSADDGCYICRRIFYKIPEHLQSQLRGLKGPLPRNKTHGGCFGHQMPRPCESRDGPPVVFLGYRAYVTSFTVCFWFGDEFFPCAHFYGRMLKLTGRALSGVLPSWRMTSTSTGSEETLGKVKEWLVRCNSDHMKCRYHREQQGSGRYPTRLLHIGSFNGHRGQDLRLRIVHRTEISADNSYATLSHRWVTANMAKLTVDNLSSWTQSIPTEILPQTFIDAARSVKHLGINYLWIDCLCIIQEGDGLEDWKHEAPTMQSIYSNAYLNICASWGSETGRLFTDRDPAMYEHASFEMRSKDGWKKNFLLVSNEEVDAAWDKLVEHSPLASRGWAFQERLLSLRNIFFCKGIVLYECYEQRWSESTGVDVTHWSPYLDREPDGGEIIKLPNIKSLLMASENPSHEDTYETWYDLAEKYSGTQLTFAEDRLAATAGIAQRYSPLLTHDVYLAGLWLSRLSLDMIWSKAERIPGPGVNDTFPRPMQFTFSWISVAGYQVRIKKKDQTGTELDKRFILPQVTCVKWRHRADTDAEMFSEDIFILPSTPTVEIMVRGVLKRMKFQRDPRISDSSHSSIVVVPEQDRTREGLEESRCEDDSNLPNAPTSWAGLDFAASEAEISAMNGSGRLFYVPWYYNDDRHVFDQADSHCLLLELACGEMGRFRRIGLLSFSPDHSELYLAPQFDEKDFPCWKYDQSTGEHTFFIV